MQDTFCERMVSGYNGRQQITRDVRPKCKAGRPMPKRKLTSEQLAALEELAQQWGKIVANRAYGEDGPDPDVDFDQMEQIAAAVSRGLARGTLEQLTTRQAQQLPEQLPCPTCQKLCPVATRPRDVVARGATVTLSEPIAHCPDCRRDFFPPADQPQT